MTDGLTLLLPAPAPPAVKPDEPHRLGSTVRDGDDVWMLADPRGTRPWCRVGEYDWRSWNEFPETVEVEREET